MLTLLKTNCMWTWNLQSDRKAQSVPSVYVKFIYQALGYEIWLFSESLEKSPITIHFPSSGPTRPFQC